MYHSGPSDSAVYCAMCSGSKFMEQPLYSREDELTGNVGKKPHCFTVSYGVRGMEQWNGELPLHRIHDKNKKRDVACLSKSQNNDLECDFGSFSGFYQPETGYCCGTPI